MGVVISAKPTMKHERNSIPSCIPLPFNDYKFGHKLRHMIYTAMGPAEKKFQCACDCVMRDRNAALARKDYAELYSCWKNADGWDENGKYTGVFEDAYMQEVLKEIRGEAIEDDQKTYRSPADWAL